MWPEKKCHTVLLRAFPEASPIILRFSKSLCSFESNSTSTRSNTSELNSWGFKAHLTLILLHNFKSASRHRLHSHHHFSSPPPHFSLLLLSLPPRPVCCCPAVVGFCNAAKLYQSESYGMNTILCSMCYFNTSLYFKVESHRLHLI